jgi:hypothetical protein
MIAVELLRSSHEVRRPPASFFAKTTKNRKACKITATPAFSALSANRCDTLGAMENNVQSPERLRRFAELYNALMAERPYMEMLARHTSMKKAELTDEERITAERCLKGNCLGELLGERKKE